MGEDTLEAAALGEAMGAITFGSNIVVNLSPNNVSGWPDGLGIHRLRFSVGYHTPPRKEVYVARNFRAVVEVSPDNGQRHRLGTAWPEASWSVTTGQFSSAAGILFDMDLSPEQLVLIERLRAGGNLNFTLKVLCDVEGSSGLEKGMDEIRFAVDRGVWIQCMKQFGVDRLILLEVDLPAEEGELATAATLLKRAREELSAGNYDGVVQKCRLAIESVQKGLKLQSGIKAAVEAFIRPEDRREMSKRQRSLLVAEAARHFAHPALHVDEAGQLFDYGRRDASFMLALASAVVSNAAGAEHTAPR